VKEIFHWIIGEAYTNGFSERRSCRKNFYGYGSGPVRTFCSNLRRRQEITVHPQYIGSGRFPEEEFMNIRVEKGNITTYAVDAIVNAANNGLLGGGGVDGAIHRAGGKVIALECDKIREKQGGCKTGAAVYTNGGNLTAKYVIHTVGPIWRTGSGQEQNLLKDCYLNSMRIAQQLHCKSIAFPNISTGVYRFLRELAADIVYDIFSDESFRNEYAGIHDVVFVNYDEENYRIYTVRFKDFISV
jgi:O-acetyl-ADP-ribose deacetylase (regulator of RNase III)